MNELVRVVSQFGLEALLEHVHAMILLVESDGRLAAWNQAFDPIQKAFPESNTLDEFFPVEDKKEFKRRLEIVHQTGESSRWQVDLLTDIQDELLCCDCLLIPIPEGRVLFVAERIADDPAMAEIVQRLNRQVKLFRLESEQAKKIAVNKQVEIESVVAQANEVSNTDALTFLSNRRQIIRELQDEVLRAERYKSRLSVSMLDVDHFKNINDRYGHDVGDQVLREIARQLRDHIRRPDMVGRYGGEEFLILLPNTIVDKAAEQAARLCSYVRETQIRVEEKIIQVTVSIGVAQFRHGTDTWHTLLSRADTAMYDAKKNGRDRWAVSKD